MNVVLISTYELGRQPFGLASPAAWLRQAGADVACLDLSVQSFVEVIVSRADLVAFYVPMHTATRMAARVVPRVRALNARAHICFYGLYAAMNDAFLRELCADSIISGEFEEELVALYRRLVDSADTAVKRHSVTSLRKQRFAPDRSGLPALSRYAKVRAGERDWRVVGNTEAKHLCRHCPIVLVYRGHFVDSDVVLADIRGQVEAGAQHITFGDPDFFNAPKHAREVVEAVHAEFPQLTYDVTIKIEHLLKHAPLLVTLKRTGCLFVTTAVESIDDRTLTLLDKDHTRADFIRIVEMFQEIALTLSPTFVTFSPLATISGYREVLAMVADLDLINHVPPIQLAIRLLIPAGSRLLNHISTALGLETPPVAIAAVTVPPTAFLPVRAKFPRRAPYGAMRSRRSFCAAAAKYFNCPVGAMTMGFNLPDMVISDLMGLATKMCEVGYIQPDEPASIPTLISEKSGSVYGPLSNFALEHDGRTTACWRCCRAVE